MEDVKEELKKWNSMFRALLEIPQEDRSQNWTKYSNEVLDRVIEWQNHVEYLENQQPKNLA